MGRHKKPHEQAQISFIIEMLRKGANRAQIIENFFKNWQNICVRTFDRRLRDAEEQFQKELELVQEKVMQEIEKEAKERQKNIMSRLERMEYLSFIVNAPTDLKKVGNQHIEILTLPDGRKRIITERDRQRAMDILNKMDGSYAPSKHEHVLTQREAVAALFPFGKPDKDLNDSNNE
jgi:hypothetical protein